MIPRLVQLALFGMQTATGAIEGTLRASDVRTSDAVVYLVPEEAVPPAPGPERQTIDQRDLRFVPRITVVAPGSSVEFLNNDPLLHNVFSPPGPGPGFDLGTYPLTERRVQEFADSGGHTILCHIHPEMLAYVVVLRARYWTASDREGRFHLDGVAPGRYELRVWHRRLAALPREVTVTADSAVHLEVFMSPRRSAGKE